MSEQPTIKLPADDGPTPDADAFMKKALGKQPADESNGGRRSEVGGQKADDDQAVADKVAADKAAAEKAGTKEEETRTSNAEYRTPNSEGVDKAVADLTVERDAAVKERDAFKAESGEADGQAGTQPARGGGKEKKQAADEWLAEHLTKRNRL